MSIHALHVKKRQTLFWLGIFVFFGVVMWVLKPVLLPFVLGISIAYLLNPLVNKIGRSGYSRMMATLFILFGFFVAFMGLLGLILPIVYKELSGLSDSLPGYIETVKDALKPYLDKASDAMDQPEAIQWETLTKNLTPAVGAGQAVLGGLAAGGGFITSLLTTLAFTPIVAFFMMKDWPKIVAWVEDLLPRHSKDDILDLTKNIDKKIAGFVRGQITVAFILGAVYAIGLSLAGLKYGFLIGLMAGMLNVIPMVGSTVGLLVAVCVAWLQTGDSIFTLGIAGFFIAGQLIEGNFLTPKLVGESVGLHPLWVFFALTAGAALMGITGMFLAVPLTAAIGVLMQYAIKQYKSSEYYEGIRSAAITNQDAVQSKKTTEKPAKKPVKKSMKNKTAKGDGQKKS